MTCDDRSFAMHYVMIMDVNASVVYFYPRLIALHEIDLEAVDPPTPMRCTYEKLADNGVYLLGKLNSYFNKDEITAALKLKNS